MSRITPLSPNTAEGPAKELLEGVQKKFGMVPNMMGAMAQAPAALRAYLGFSQALATGRLGAALHEQIALAVAGANACGYCASAHTAIGKGAGVAADELGQNLEGKSDDPKTQAALTFARKIVERRGWVSDADVRAFRDAGYSEGDAAEVIASVALNTYTNYFNHIAQVEIDFPKVEVGEPVGV